MLTLPPETYEAALRSLQEINSDDEVILLMVLCKTGEGPQLRANIPSEVVDNLLTFLLKNKERVTNYDKPRSN